MQTLKRKLQKIEVNRLRELPLRLGFPLKMLEGVAKSMDTHYRKHLRLIDKKERLIFSGDKLLRKIHKQIESNLLDRFDMPEEIQGGIPGRSTRTNAQKHVGKKNVAHFDLANFYPSISSGRIYKLFRTLGCEPESARLLSRLVSADGHLPQGFSTSPKIAGLMLLRANARIRGLLAKRSEISASFWIDDLVLSSNSSLRELEPTLHKIVQEEDFKFNEKTSYSSRHVRQIATGGVVNNKLGVPKKRVRDFRRTLHRIKVMGLKSYGEKYHSGVDLLRLKQKISGELGYMLSLNQERYSIFQKQWKILAAHC